MQKLWRAIAWTAAILLGVGLLARALLLDVWTVPEGDARLAAAIAPTLSPGDTVIMLTRGAPGFGDLVRCADPDDAKRFIVARIAGTQGDNVEVDDSALHVNGHSYHSDRSCPESSFTVAHPTTGNAVDLTCDVVQMGGGWHYRVHASSPSAAAPVKAHVDADMIYLLSDDRTFHDDSRDFGAVPRASCKGLIFFKLWGKGGFADEKQRFLAIH